LQTLFTDFDCRNDQNLKSLHKSPPDSWPVCFTVKAKRHLGGSAPPPAHAWPRHYIQSVLQRLTCFPVSGAAPEFFYLRAMAQGVWGPIGVQRRSPDRGPFEEAEAVCRHCLQILTAETSDNLKFLHYSPLRSWPERHFGGSASLATHG